MGIHHGAILRILRDDGPQSRAELARRTALSPTALTHLTAQLLNDGTVTELTQVVASGAPVGRPATLGGSARLSRRSTPSPARRRTGPRCPGRRG